jgi:hypothetical protein
MASRVLAASARLLFFLIAVGALVALVTRAGAYPDTGGPVDSVPGGGPNHIVVSSGPQGALVYSADFSQSASAGADLVAYNGDGVSAWRVSGVEDAIPATLPEAIAWRFEDASATGAGGETTVVRVRKDGNEQVVARSVGELRPWYANSVDVVCVETVYDEVGLPHSKIVTCGETGRQETLLPGGGGIEQVSVSIDGSRLAAISTGDEGYLLNWLDRQPGQPWRLVAQVPGSGGYVALASDGKQAVLGPQSPVLLEFGAAEGEALPVDFVSEVRFGVSRLLLVHFRVDGGQPLTTLAVLGLASNEIEWQRELDGDLGVATDADISRLAYIQAGARGVVVVDMVQGDEQVIHVETADDLGFLDKDHLFVALRDDTVRVLSMGGDR